MADTPDPHLGRLIAGHRVEQRIGRGGMGVVYRASHLQLGRPAAIKIIAPELAESGGFRERFIREARIAASLSHPNVVTVYDAGEVDGLLYIAMQYVAGSDLGAILRAETRLGPYRALDVCRQVAAALDAAHAVGLIHRDVKPENVLIEGRHAFLSDFGLTKRTGSGKALTKAGDVVGTIHYVAPEQIEGREITGRADVYALGCLLYHCLTGELPFERESDVAVIYAHLRDAPRSVTEVRTELPAGLDAVIAKALEKDPRRRFGTCSDVILAARSVLDAAGPLADRAPARRVPEGGDRPDVATVVGLPVPPDALPPSRRTRVLLAGVDAQSRAVARVALGDGCEVREAQRGATLSAAREAPPDLVLLGWEGPERHPGDLVGELRADPLTRDAKVLLLVDWRRRQATDVLGTGADESLAAPFSPLQLQVKLRKLLG